MPRCPRCGEYNARQGIPCLKDPGWFSVNERALEHDMGSVPIGRLISGRYVPLSLIGEGGMGHVYSAIVADQPGRKVALKILKQSSARDETVRKRFFREAQIMKMFSHPNLVGMYDSGEVIEGKGKFFIVMPMLEGRTLEQGLRGPLPATQVMRILKGIAQGLATAHRSGIVHRDLKPGNIFLERNAKGHILPKILDFGLAKLSAATSILTQAGMVFGTPSYMSPEQAAGDINITPAADVYAFGIILFRLLSGILPFKAENPIRLLHAHLTVPAPELILRQRLRVPRSLVQLTYQCLEKDPEMRPGNGQVLINILLQIEAEMDAQSGNISSAPRSEGHSSRRRAEVRASRESTSERDPSAPKTSKSTQPRLRRRASASQGGSQPDRGRGRIKGHSSRNAEHPSGKRRRNPSNAHSERDSRGSRRQRSNTPQETHSEDLTIASNKQEHSIEDDLTTPFVGVSAHDEALGAAETQISIHDEESPTIVNPQSTREHRPERKSSSKPSKQSATSGKGKRSGKRAERSKSQNRGAHLSEPGFPSSFSILNLARRPAEALQMEDQRQSMLMIGLLSALGGAMTLWLLGNIFG